MRNLLRIGLPVVVILALLAGGAVYWLAFMPNTPRFEGERGVSIPRGSSFADVVDSLEARGLLTRRSSFTLFGRLTGWQDQVKAGHYAFESGVSNYKILDDIRKGLQDPVRLTIPPGTRPEVVAAVAGRDMAFGAEALAQALRDTTLAAELDTDPQHLFGYMMPETYFFYWLTDAPTVIRKVKEQFDQFYAREIQAGAEKLNLTRSDVVTLASIVEWETGIPEERPRVAGVYLNRLRIGMALQADPTVQYAVLEKEGQKRRLLFEDYKIQHPYNTYLYRGLPPGPLTNPSPSSIRAVVNAEAHDFLYFVARGDGSHVFSKTLTEHNRAAEQYHQLMRQRRREQAQQGN